MNTVLADCSKCLKPKRMQKAKSKHCPRDKEQPIDLDPSKAWIKNVGAGTTTQMPKFKAKRDNASSTTLPTSRPSTPLTPSTKTAANTTNNESVTATQTNGMPFSSGVEKVNQTAKITDSSMASIQQINDVSMAIGNHTCDTDGSNYETCIEFDATLVGASVAEAIDAKPIKPVPTQSKTMNFKTNHKFQKNRIDSANAVLDDETSLYEGMGTIDWMSSRMADPEMLSQELSTLKREVSENFDDTLIGETLPNGLDISIKPSRIHELSIPLASFDFQSSSSLSSPSFDSSSTTLTPSDLYDTKSNANLSSLPLNSTSLPANTFSEIDMAANVLREMNWTEPEVTSNANILDAHTPFKIPSYEKFKSDKKSCKSRTKSQLGDVSGPLLAQASSQVPNTPSLSNGAFIHPVYMRDEDVNRLIQSGHIFFIDGRLHYKHKTIAQKRIF